MQATEATRFIDSYLRWLRENLRVQEIGDAVAITTPFLDRHNDEIELVLEKQNGSIRLTDDGYTIRDLRGSGVDLSKGARQQHLLKIINGYGVHLEGDVLLVKTTLADFAQKKHNLLQAILAVDDLHVTAKEEVLQFFREDVEELLRAQEVPLFRDVKLSGKSGLDHHFDIGFPSEGRRPERVLRAINTLRRDTATSMAFSVDDVRNVRGQDALGAFAFINDTENAPAAEHIEVLTSYGVVPILWRDRQRAREVIMAA
jgi:Domain of unknown function DUF1828/Domain of unknown function DUF1829